MINEHKDGSSEKIRGASRMFFRKKKSGKKKDKEKRESKPASDSLKG